MQKVQKCFKCGKVFPYDTTYENGDFFFLLDEDKKFVGHVVNGNAFCESCMPDV